MGKFDLGPAEKERWKITNQQQKEISDMYSELAKQARDKAEKLKGKENISAKLQQAQLNKLAGDLSDSAKSIEAKLSNTVKQGIESVSKAVVVSSQAFNKSVGLGIEGAYSHVPKGIVESLVSGNLYKGDWSLSKAIYTDVSKVQKDISTVVAQGLAANKSAYEIAKDLEMYVDPKAKKPWDWGKVYPGTRKQIDYNAQRLARTMTAHAYEQSLLVVTQPNPFVTGIKWRSAMIHGRTCEICRERNGKVYPKDELPLDHPNGLCTFLAEVPDSLENIADELADWVEGKESPALDGWYVQQMQGSVEAAKKVNSKALDKSYKNMQADSPEYKEFDDYYRTRYDDLYEKHPDQYRAIAESYTGGEYAAMNKLLRTGKYDESLLVQLSSKEELLAEIEYAKKAITGIPCPEDVTVFRRVKSLGDMSKLTEGSTYKNKQLLSSTLDKKAYEGFETSKFEDFGKVEIEINVPKGYSDGAYIHSLSMQNYEYEFLFAPDTEFEIVSMTPTKVVMIPK